MKLLPALLLALTLACAGAAAFAQGAYRWVGKDGKVHYSDQPPPPAETVQVEQRRLSGSVIDSGGKLPYETRQAARDFPVTLYVTPECDPACKNGRDYLKKRGIPYAEKLVKTSAEIDAFKKVAGTNDIGAPTLVVGATVQVGFEAGLWGGLLDGAGYPAAK